MHTNRLAQSASPYLLQHAHNPVDWYEWGPEAFEEASRRDVPIFLSIGYSTCYWCHVMERESFESERIAAMINEGFVAVKVDREERPDVDDLYMAATQISTGGGGWPLTAFLDPSELRPFFCGTYFPPEQRSGHPSIVQVLEGMSNAWQNDRERVNEAATRLASEVREHLAAKTEPKIVGETQVSQAAGILLRMHDATEGGFGRAPKFPQPAYCEFLLDAREHADPETVKAIDAAVRSTLDAMMIGGLHDHVGGGFHRYAVDSTWTVPHFEKMLYDNAGLAALFARASAVYDDHWYRRTSLRTLEYVKREMTDPSECFYAAQDAEVDGKEGLNYLWSPEQVRECLEAEDAEFAVSVFGLNQPANFQDPHHPNEPPAHVVRFEARPETLAAKLGMSSEAFENTLDRVSTAMLARRNERKQPRLDDKVIAAWNGMMISAYARASMHLQSPKLLETAFQAIEAAEDCLCSEAGELSRSARLGRVSSPGVLEDYANLIDAWTTIATTQASATQDPSLAIARAKALLEKLQAFFIDQDSGLIHDTASASSDLFVRASTTYDGATLSGRSVLAGCLVELARLTGDEQISTFAARTLVQSSSVIAEQPVSMIGSTRALLAAMRAGIPIAEAFVEAGAGHTASDTSDPEVSPVEIYASEERLTIDPETPATMSMVVQIADGYHVIAAVPGASGLFPFRVAIGGGEGVAAYAEYPDGTPLRIDGIDHEILVYEGSTEMNIAIELVGPITGRPMLRVSYQACEDAACQPPRTVELDVAIDVTGSPTQEEHA